MLFPIFIMAGAMLCGAPILLHFLRPKPRRVVAFPTLRFLKPAILRESRRHKILRWIVLALRCLVLLLIALAFARPLLESLPPSGKRAVVFVVDNSYSMQTGDRRANLSQWAAQQLDDFTPGDEAALLVMHPTPTWIAPLGKDYTAVAQQMLNLPPGYESSDYRAALRMAGESLRENPAKEKRIVLVGDNQQLGWQNFDFSKPLPPGVDLRVPALSPAPKDQIALTELKIIEGAKGASALVKIMPYALANPTRQVTLKQNGEVVGEETIELLPGQSAFVRFDLPETDQTRWLEAIIEGDELLADNAVYAVDPREDGISVMLAPQTGGVDYLALAIEATSHAGYAPLQVIEWPQGDWPTGTVAILRGDAPFSGDSPVQLKRFLANGGKAIFFLDGSAAQTKWLQEQGLDVSPIKIVGANLRDWDLEHPAMEPFQEGDLSPLLGLTFPTGIGLSPEQTWPIARWPDRSAAIAEANIVGGTIALIGFTPNGGDSLTRSSPFVPLIHGLARWLSGQQGATETLRVGSTLDLPSTGKWETLAGPQQTMRQDVTGSIRLSAPGVYRFTSQGGVESLYAVNLPVEESDLRPWPDTRDFARLQNTDPEPKERIGAMLPLGDSGIWWWLLLAGFIIILFELRLSNLTAR